MENCNLLKAIDLQLYNPKDGKFFLRVFWVTDNFENTMKVVDPLPKKMCLYALEIRQFHFKRFKVTFSIATHPWIPDKDLLPWLILSFQFFPPPLTYYSHFYAPGYPWWFFLFELTHLSLYFVMSEIWSISRTSRISMYLHMIAQPLI